MGQPFDFTTVYDRRGWDALAVEGLGRGGTAPEPPKEGFDPIPMWVADMSFATAPSIPEAIVRRAQHPLYGYFDPPESYYQAIIDWQRTRNGVEGLEPAHIGYENGVLGGVVSALNVLCSKGDAVLLHAPTYIGFTSSLTGNGYRIVHSPLVKDAAGIWRMDLEDMEEKLKRHRIHAAILCSPHNPSGRVWERRELEAAMALYAKYDVTVISDEIWSDLLLYGHRHIPTQSISEDARRRTVALYAPSKTFNLAGLVGSYHIVYDRRLRERLEKESSLSHYNSMNVLSLHALLGAYCPQGAAWVDALCAVLTENAERTCSHMERCYSGVSVSRPQGTYMVFPDVETWCRQHDVTMDGLLKRAWDVGVAWQDGRAFHGEWNIRMNLALPASRLEEALQRLDRHVFCQ